MPRQNKTSKNSRTNYIYYTSDGAKIVVTPGENGVTEADIELLHEMDDAAVDEQRRYDYRMAAHLDGYSDGEGESAGDRNGYLADSSANPEDLLIFNEDEKDYGKKLLRLGEALDGLLPQQRALFEKVYIQRRSNTDIAASEGVTEAAIRNRLKKIHEKLRKYFP